MRHSLYKMMRKRLNSANQTMMQSYITETVRSLTRFYLISDQIPFGAQKSASDDIVRRAFYA